MNDFEPICLVGGSNIRSDITRLQRGGLQVVVGTPGRVNHMIRERYLNPRGVKMLVLDEADEMLNVGFEEQVYSVFRYGFTTLYY